MVSSPYENLVSNPAEDNGPLMSITFWSLTAVSLAFLTVRLCIRQQQGKIWIDDILLSLSWLFLLAQATLNQLAINLGFGKHVLDINFDNSTRIAYYVTLLRLTDGWPKRWAYFAMTTLAIFAIPTTVMPFVQLWAAAMDISLALLPWRILWGLQMRLAEKIGVCVAMSLGILAGSASIIRGRYIDLLGEQDLSYDAYNSVIWSAADTAMTIVATSMPVLRVFVTKAVNSAIETYQNSSSRSRNKSRMENSTAKSTGADISLRQSSKKTTDTLQSKNQDFLEDRVGQDSKGYLELEEVDLVVDERTGRITAVTPDLAPDTVEHRKAEWPLEK
ncbi:hypothetical protein E8E12_002732 [Didymella heteroderae]|uniref:Rhodopsin domain-containing protein n=1 Tax=Didymella heteroderae TaxID=1769908 RepID=A0A9P4WTL5_9PLEO|nr:hypothetical protein E8E12_002732 [Didymella heteroderae]